LDNNSYSTNTLYDASLEMWASECLFIYFYDSITAITMALLTLYIESYKAAILIRSLHV